MTKEQKEKALAFLKDMQECTYDGVGEIRTAIESLEQQPSEDAISRQAVLDTLMKYEKPCDDRQDFYLDSTTEFEEEIKEIPPVTPTRKSGLHWIERFDNESMWLECPHCHIDSIAAYNYCPNCGASFKEEKRGNTDGSN